MMREFRFDDPDEYINGTPYDELANLRRRSPFSWQEGKNETEVGFWLSMAYSDIVAISRRPDLFATSAPLLADPLPRDLWNVCPALAMIANNLMTADPITHRVYRSLINKLFGSERILQFSSKIKSICSQARERLSERGRFDFADELALGIPVQVVLGVVLGVPDRDIDKVARLVLTINAKDDPVYHPTADSLLDAAEELLRYGIELMNLRRQQPEEDLLSELVCGHGIEGISTEELFLMYWFPLAAGAFDTTASTIAGTTLELLRNAEQLELLNRQPVVSAQTVDEMIRWVTPVNYFRRTATVDCEINGKRIKKGDKIVLCYASGNRDEDVFSNPNSLDINRAHNSHLAFGYGPHHCLGSRIAALLLSVFWDEFRAFLKSGVKIDGPAIRTRSVWMNRIRSLPVRIT